MSDNQKIEKKRLKILNDEEIENIYGRPYFTYEERCSYFFLSQPEKDLVQLSRSIKSQAYFILQLGYFKAKHIFFTFELEEVDEDLKYILKNHLNNSKILYMGSIDKNTRLKQQRLILELYKYQICNADVKKQLEERARKAASVCSKPIFIYREIMHYLSEQQIIVPGYSFMQETVGKAINYEQNRLVAIVKEYLKPDDITSLSELLEDSTGLYEITLLKHEPRDFSFSEIKTEINRGKKIQSLYQLAKNLLPILGISNESVKYYSSLVGYYSVFRLKQLNEWTAYIYLLCFAYNRYQQMHDNLINTFIYNVRRYSDESRFKAKERIYETHIEINQNIKKAGQILKIFTDDTIANDTPFQKVKDKVFSIIEPNKLNDIADQISTSKKLDEVAYQWEHIDKLSRQFKQHIRPVFSMLDFAAPLSNDSLIEAIDFIKLSFEKSKPLGQYQPETLPNQFIPEGMKKYIYKQNKYISQDRYEFLVYRLLRNSLEAGDVFCRDSIRFRSIEDDLISDLQWQQKEKLIAEFGLSILNQPIEQHLAELEQKLEKRIKEVNERISTGENEHFQIKKRGSNSRWTLNYSNDSEPINHPFYDELKQIDIGSVMHFVNHHCNFTKAFDHVLGRYSKQEKDDIILIATLIAWGTNMGLGRMGEISDIAYSMLAAYSDNFLRPETLKEANDLVSNDIYNLPIFRHYDIGEVIHSSSDGQKIETRTNTINSRHSPKYFGLRKGIVDYTLVANNIPINARIIGANEHESHFVYDILSSNTTVIHPDVHSTDTHGTNEVNFAILNFFGYQFAPRYKDIYDKVSKSLYGFNHPSHYGDIIIKPVRKINTELIIEEWENIKRIILSLALKTTTQSIIIGKLSNYARKNKTKRALWEYDNIIKSLYFLDYIDSLPLRQNVQKALNRGESYHKLRRAVSYANFGKLRFKTDQEQQLWSGCSRLLCNCIIYYNASILSNMLTYKEKNGQNSDLLKLISPIAWQHINLYGRYEFNKKHDAVNMEAIIQQLANFQWMNNLTQK